MHTVKTHMSIHKINFGETSVGKRKKEGNTTFKCVLKSQSRHLLCHSVIVRSNSSVDLALVGWFTVALKAESPLQS